MPIPALVVEKISHALDQPFANSLIVPTYLLNRFVRQNLEELKIQGFETKHIPKAVDHSLILAGPIDRIKTGFGLPRVE